MKKYLRILIWLIIIPSLCKAIDLCATKKENRTTPDNCTVDPKVYEWFEFSKIEEERVTRLIRGKIDPLDCIPVTKDPLQPVWEYTGSKFLSPVMIFITLFPIIAGLIAREIARPFRPPIVQDVDRNYWGFKCKTFPVIPVAFIQQSDKDKEFKRIKRNTVGWYCHKWFFSSNDIVGEITTTKKKKAEPKKDKHLWNKLSYWSKFYTLFRNTRKKTENWNDAIDRMTNERKWEHVHDIKKDTRFFIPENVDIYPSVRLDKMDELKARQPKLRKLWFKLQEWTKELEVRKKLINNYKTVRKSLVKIDTKNTTELNKKNKDFSSSNSSSWEDTDDSYWGSSESFSSDQRFMKKKMRKQRMKQTHNKKSHKK